jgi:hypothetical protein
MRREVGTQRHEGGQPGRKSPIHDHAPSRGSHTRPHAERGRP